MTDVLALPRAGLAAALGTATAVRGARVFHPRGTVRAATLVVQGPGGWGVDLLDRPGRHEGVVRLSRGIGLPRPLPDVEGLALRLPGLGSDGAPLDLAINSAWRYVFAPSLVSATWSCVLPYRTGRGDILLLGARPTPSGFDMLGAAPLGPWQRWGRLDVGPSVDVDDLRTMPTVGADDLRPVEAFRRLRTWAYLASQAAR